MPILINETRKATILTCIIWWMLVSLSFIWNVRSDYTHNLDNLHQSARSFFNQIQTDRRWNAETGGVYVPVSDKIRPNKYLKVAQRDIEDADGAKYTMVNPAYMTRLISEIAEEDKNGVSFHITSLNPINKDDNQPDEWERKALVAFETGEKEIAELFNKNENEYLNYMAPLIVKNGCMKCHAEQGYKVGDIRGGIRVTIPITGSLLDLLPILVTHLLFMLAGEMAILLIGRHLGIRESNILEEKKRAEDALAAKSAFLACMSHEIRTPMNGVIGMSELLTKTSMTEEQKKYLSVVISSGKTLIAIINDILDFSKIESGKMKLEETPISLKKCIKDVYDILAKKSLEKNVELLYVIDEDIPEILLGDRTRIRQIFTNIINNAVKFTPSGKITTKINLKSHDRDTVDVKIRVTDSGIGIPQDKLNAIFDSFSQADNSTTRQYGGTGLGLAITRRLVENMGGYIYAENNMEKGASFVFTLKFKKADGLSLEDDSCKQLQGEPKFTDNHVISDCNTTDIDGSELAKSPLEILLVEDNKINIMVADALLKKLGCKIDIALNGLEAIERLKTKNYDIVFMDVQMPKMNGLEATQEIRRNGSGVINHNVPIIAMTANAMKGDDEICINAGMDDYLSKPISPDCLKEILNKWVLHRNVGL